MRLLFLIILFIVFPLNSKAQSKQQRDILNSFIEAHNIGSESSVTSFIKKTYKPEVYKNINLKDHVNFYFQIINEFGLLSHGVYKEIEISPTTYVVHLIKKEDELNENLIKPEDILVVKIDLVNEDSKFMPHGLGLGSLLCEQRER